MSALQPRTFVLMERRPRRCRLSSLDLGLLLARYPGRFEVVPAGRKGVWRVTARGCAGIVVTPTVRLIIRPKITLDNLFFLVDPTAAVVAAADRSTPIDGDEVFDFLAGQFASRLTRLAAAGLQRGYQERTEQGVVLQGRIDMPAQLRQGPVRLEQLHYRYDEFTPDIPCNRTLKAIAECLLLSPFVSSGVKRLSRQALMAFDQVRAELDEGSWGAAEGHQLPGEYSLLLDLGRMLLDGLAPGPGTGPTPGPAFLLNTERVWERYITRVVCDGFAGIEGAGIAVQQDVAAARGPDGEGIFLRPDLVLSRRGTAPLVIDAKWKPVGRGAPPAEDLHQVTAYATALGARRAILVYPGRRDAVRKYTFEQAPLEVEVRKLRVQGTRQALAEAARMFVQELVVHCG
jgi:5-methylcytosine-specific restriction enzyme subunit McrC